MTATSIPSAFTSGAILAANSVKKAFVAPYLLRESKYQPFGSFKQGDSVAPLLYLVNTHIAEKGAGMNAAGEEVNTTHPVKFFSRIRSM